MPIYLVTRTDFEHYDDEEGRFKVLDAYSELELANKAARICVRQAWREADNPAYAKRHTEVGLINGERYGASIRLDECDFTPHRVRIRVEKRKLRTSLPRIAPEDEETEQEVEEQQSGAEATQSEEAIFDGMEEPGQEIWRVQMSLQMKPGLEYTKLLDQNKLKKSLPEAFFNKEPLTASRDSLSI